MFKRWILNNRYIVIKKLAIGRFATLYKGWDLNLKRFVAIKKIHQFSSDAKFVNMFCTEVINTSKFEHKNIIKVINFLKDASGSYYIIMEYVKGVSLDCLLQRCEEYSVKVSSVIALYIIREVAEALEYAHSVKDELTGELQGIIHRDISPANIMVYFDGRVKLANFGIAKAGSQAIKKGRLKGKISYMSPEQAEGREEIDHRSDLFGCGIILYEMLTGKNLYEGDNQIDILKKMCTAKVNLKKLKEIGISEKVRRIIEKLLQKKREVRYQTASQLIKEINNYLKGTGVENFPEELKEVNTNVLRKEWKHIKEDMEAEKSGTLDALEKDDEAVETSSDFTDEPRTSERGVDEDKPTPATEPKDIPDFVYPIPPEPAARAPEESPGGEKEKTVFDFMLDTAQKYKKILISTSISIIMAFFVYTVIDTYMQLTPWGTKIHNKIWPPALQIDSIPTDAKIQLLNKDGHDLIKTGGYQLRTPSNIKKIPPGIYTLKLSKENYGDMVRKVTVFGERKGEQNISIARAQVVKDMFIIPFEVMLEVNSTPPEVNLLINNKRVGKTPFKVAVEIGQHNILLSKKRFEMLGSGDVKDEPLVGMCTIDLFLPVSQQRQVDRRYWEIKKDITEEGQKRYILHGTLWKKVDVVSVPRGVSVYINDAYKGTTPMKELALTSGFHAIKMVKSGYKSWSRKINVDAESSDKISAYLKKEITIHSYKEGDPTKDIGASVRIRGTRLRGRTPFKVALILKEFTFVLEKEPMYKPVAVTRNIGKLKNRLNVFMELKNPYLEVTVRDFKSGDRVEEAMVWINGIYWERTNKMGLAARYIDQLPGDFRIEVKADRYEDFNTMIVLNKGERKEIEIILGSPKDGTIVVDTSEGFLGASIYKNGEYIGDTLKQISGVFRGSHRIEIKSDEFSQRVIKEVKINEPNQLVILKLVRDGTKIYLKELAAEIYWEEYNPETDMPR